ncbi:MAG TPA: secondary thiamine-phosphate synthase enzyme YjbQ [Candidatus Hydrogenedentes bacterium]|nr:secondary thiamine-phosphate synthase enzyme YjbQ [Candidatus Hydrogenedentota bacterium]
MTFQEFITLHTATAGQMHDLTEHVQEIVTRSGIRTGVAHVFNIGSTAGIGTIEYEPGLIEDLPRELSRLFPPGRHYAHEQTWHDGNGHSHLQATLLGPETTVPVREARLALGTWQQIFHVELDVKPRTREVVVTVIGG